MATVGISEFTFGYAFLYEQTHSQWGNLTAAPILPNLRQEQAQGWDAQLPRQGMDFYYQFKLSDYLSRRNATFIKDGTYTGPYYRVALHKKNRNQQHRRLREHCVVHPHTYYVAPEFNKIEDFNESFLSREITANCRIIRLQDCEDINDGEQHYFTYRQYNQGFVQHSEPKRQEHSYSGKELEKLYRSSSPGWKPINRVFAEELFDKTFETARRVFVKEEPRAGTRSLRLLEFQPKEAEPAEILRRTSEILSVVLGVTLVIVGTR